MTAARRTSRVVEIVMAAEELSDAEFEALVSDLRNARDERDGGLVAALVERPSWACRAGFGCECQNCRPESYA